MAGDRRTGGARKPVLLTVDDEPDVLRAVRRDLVRHFAQDYRVLAASSGEEALDALRELRDRGDRVALLLVDQRMPGLSGVELLEKAMVLHPDAKRVLLTAYADTEAAIAAINRVRLDYYILKPWHPPEERLYPVLDDLLDEWRGRFPAFEGPTIVGMRWSAASHAIRDFLARNQHPYRWLDVETNEEARALAAQSPDAHLPLVLLPGGERLESPSNVELARKLEILKPVDTPYFDLVIVGAGPGGLAAAVYGASEGLSTALVEREAPGGQAGQSNLIENYLGFPSGLSGADLSRRAVMQARRFDVRMVSPAEATHLEVADGYRIVRLGDGTELSCRVLIIATGVSYRRLQAPGAPEFEGVGLFYGGTTVEARSCIGQDVHIVGAANSAGQAAVYFSQHARRVHLLCRADSLEASMSRYLVTQIEGTPNIDVHVNTEIGELHGDHHLEKLTLVDNRSGATRDVATGGVFVFIGADPHTKWLEGVVARDERGFIPTGTDMLRTTNGWPLEREPFLLETSVPGVFAVGDVRANAIRRVATAVGEGSIAVQLIHRYLATT
jgi:thioredoxin reductase (NADPH)